MSCVAFDTHAKVSVLSAHGSLRIASASRWLDALVRSVVPIIAAAATPATMIALTAFFICAPPVCGKTISPLPVISTREDREWIAHPLSLNRGRTGTGRPGDSPSDYGCQGESDVRRPYATIAA